MGISTGKFIGTKLKVLNYQKRGKNINGELVKNAVEGVSENIKVRTIRNKPSNLLRINTLIFSMAGYQDRNHSTVIINYSTGRYKLFYEY